MNESRIFHVRRKVEKFRYSVAPDEDLTLVVAAPFNLRAAPGALQRMTNACEDLLLDHLPKVIAPIE